MVNLGIVILIIFDGQIEFKHKYLLLQKFQVLTDSVKLSKENPRGKSKEILNLIIVSKVLFYSEGS